MTNIRQLSLIFILFLGVCKSSSPLNTLKNHNLTMDELEDLVKNELGKHREGCQEMDVLAVEVRHDEDDEVAGNKVFEYTIRCVNRGIEEICEVFFVKNTSKISRNGAVSNFIVDCKGST